MRTWSLLVGLLFLIVAAAGSAAAAADNKRVALVIGNSNYQHTPKLDNPKNDAADVVIALRKLGFRVIEGVDVDKPGMDRKIREFAEALGGSDVGLFFYAGHGLQVGGQNYLVPVDAKLTSAAALDFEMIRLDLIHRTMERETKTNILFLDACRDNPLARNLARAMGTRSADIGRGLATVESGVGTLISFSTQPGNVALDGDGRNSPYAGAVVTQLGAPGADISDMLIRVRNDVMSATRGRQIPWEHSALTAKFYFTPPVAAAAVDAERPPAPTAPSASLTYEQQMEIALWDRVKDSKDPAELQAYIDRFPQGTFAPLARLMIQRVKREEEQRIAAVREQLLEEARKKAQATGPAPQPAAPPPTTVATLPAATAPPTPPPTTNPTGAPPPDREALTKSLQRELSRVGCNPGSVDGIWGGQTSEALKNFGRHAKVSVQSDEPTPSALEAVTARKDRACPLVCDDDEMVVKGKCVAKPAPAAKKKPQTRSAESTGTKRRTTQSEPEEKPKAQTQPRQQGPAFRPCLGVISCGMKVLPF